METNKRGPKPNNRYCKGVFGREHDNERVPVQGAMAMALRGVEVTAEVCKACHRRRPNSGLYNGLTWDEYTASKVIA